MKKYFLILGFCLFSFFLFGSGILKAKASDFEYSFENNPENFLNQNDWNFTNKLNELVNEVKKTGKFYAIVLSYNDNTKKFNNSDLNIYLFDEIPNNIIYENTNIRYVYKPNESTNIVRWIMNGRYDINLTENKINEYISLVSDVSYYRVYDSISSVTIYTKNWIVYDSNFDIYNNSEFVYNILGQKVIQGDKFPTIKKVLDKKNTYTENLRVNSKDIDRIEYTFDLENNNNILHEFNFSTTWISSSARLDLFGAPYLEYKKDNIVYKLPLDKSCAHSLEEQSYCDTQINNFIDIQELKFVVNFNNINNLNGQSEILIHFDSSLNFTKNVIYVNNEDSNYVEVDFTNKYGVLLIPKLRNSGYDQEVYSEIYYMANHLDINLYDSIETTKDPVKTESGHSLGSLWGRYNYLFRFNNYNQYLFFVNKNYLTDTGATKVRYDKRYFVHSICSSSDSCNTVVNPNTGEEIVIKPPNIENDSTSDNSLFSMFHFFEKPIKFIFDGIGTLYNDYTLPIVQKYWYFGFGFTVFIIILKLFF